MSLPSVQALVDVLRDSQLLEPVHLEEITEDLVAHYHDPRALADLLVEWNWLTPYQAEQILKGAASELVVGPYHLLEPLGRGGMGEVFKALQRRLNRVVALKVIRQDCVSQDQEAIQRFQREARAAAQLSHPNVVVVYDADQADNRHYIAMEFVEGTDLGRLVKETGPLPISQACEFIRQAAMGLQHAHECGLVHRDIKPSNLLVTTKPRGISGFHRRPTLPGRPGERVSGHGEKTMIIRTGRANSLAAPPREDQSTVEPPRAIKPVIGPSSEAVIKILDMGLARLIDSSDNRLAHQSLTEEGVLMGTPDYIAPEQARNARAADIRSDLYSLGCTLYFLLTGQPPFPTGTVVEKLLMHQLDDPQPIDELRPAVSAEVQAVVRKLTAKRPEDRYQTPAELIEAITALPPSGSSTAVPRPEPAAPAVSSPPATLIPKQLERSDRPEVQLPVRSEPVSGSPVEVAQDQKCAPPSGPEPATRIAEFKGHRNWVTALAFTPDRNTLASGGTDGPVRLWRFTRNRPSQEVLSHTQVREVNSLVFAPDNNTLAVGSGTLEGFVWLWDLSTEPPQEKALLRGHSAPVDALAFSRDGKQLITGSSDRTLRLWSLGGDLPTERAVLKGHTASVKAVAFAPDGKTVASGGQDGTLRLWDVSRTWPKQLQPLKWRAGPVNSVAFSPAGDILACASPDQTVRLWDVTTVRPRERAVFPGHQGMVRLVQFSPDGNSVTSVGDGGRVILWAVATHEKLHDWQLPSVMQCSVALTCDGRYLATGNSDGTVSVFRLYPKKTDA
jgi:serine/threonine-protein kinase